MPFVPCSWADPLGKWLGTVKDHSLSVMGTHRREASCRNREKWSKLPAGGGGVELGRE